MKKFSCSSRLTKIFLLISGMKDKVFLADLKEIEDDFTSIDQENWN